MKTSLDLLPLGSSYILAEQATMRSEQLFTKLVSFLSAQSNQCLPQGSYSTQNSLEFNDCLKKGALKKHLHLEVNILSIQMSSDIALMTLLKTPGDDE
jgi:hypothetical protein